MKPYLAAALVVVCAQAFGQDGYRLKADDPPTGSRIRLDAARFAPYPLDRKYEDFTVKEREAFKRFYEPMPEDDEPPFPRSGLASLILDVRDAAMKRQAKGPLVLVATVNAAGNVEKVDIFSSPDEQLARYTATKLVRTPFKPARCAGQPCRMEFPFFARVGD